MIIQIKRKFNNYFSNLIFSKTIACTGFNFFSGYSSNKFGGNHVSDFLFMSWFIFCDKKRKQNHKFCKNNFLNNIK